MAIWPLLYFSQKKRFDSRVESDKKVSLLENWWRIKEKCVTMIDGPFCVLDLRRIEMIVGLSEERGV